MTTSRRVLYLDPSLGVSVGHHAPLARGFAAVLGAGIDFAGARGGTASGLPGQFMPVFAHRIEDAFRVSRTGISWLGSGPIADLARALVKLRPSAGRSLPPARTGVAMDVERFKRLFAPLRAGPALHALVTPPDRWRAVVCIGADPATLSALHDAREIFAAPGAPDLHLVFMYPEHEFLGPRTETAYFQLVRDMLAWPRAPHLYAELSEHAADLQRRLGAPVQMQILPYRVRPLASTAAVGDFVATVLGAGRADKAFDVLPDIVAATHRLDADIRFRIQRPAARQRLGGAVRALERQSSVTLLPAVLDEPGYESELARAQVVLLAYDPARYKRRGSGVLIDAFVAGKPVVCAAGTAMAAALQHGNGVAGEGAAGLARALAESRLRYQELLIGAERARAATIAAITGGTLLSALNCGDRAWA